MYHPTPWMDRVIDNMFNGQYKLAAEQMIQGVRGRPLVVMARSIRLTGLMQERYGDKGLDMMKRLSDVALDMAY